MIDKYENVIKKQKEMHDILRKQLEANDVMIDSQKQQIQVLKEEVLYLKKQIKKLMDQGNDLYQANEQLEEICIRQQALLDEFSDMMK